MSSILEKAKRGLPLDDVLIIDIHNHLGQWHNFNVPNGGTAEAMLASMDYMGFNKVFATAHSSIGPNYIYGNDLVMEAVKKYPDRFMGYVTLNPNYLDDMKNEIERCFKLPGMMGIKLHPGCHGVPIDYKNYHFAYEAANDRKCPVLIHVWGQGAVAQVNKLASMYPNAQFIMGHGGADALAMEDAVVAVNRHDNVYIDLAVSFAPQGNLEWFTKQIGSKKILFGTDMPFYDAKFTFGRTAMADISDDEKRDIFGLNAQRILSLQEK